MTEYSVIRIDSEDFQSLIPLMKDCFGMDVNIDYFKWKYTQNPSGSFIGFIAVSTEKEVAAYYGVIPESYSFNGEARIIYQSCDTMTHSRHRRKGLFQLLAKNCFDYLRENNKLFIIGFGGGQSTPGFIKFGWRHLFDINYYFYPRIFSFLPQISFSDKKYNLIDNCPVSDLNSFFEEQNSNMSNGVRVIRDFELFKWRISNPLHDYKILLAKDKNQLVLGYLIYYVEKGKFFLFDHLANSPKVGKLLIGFLKRKIKTDSNLKGIVAFSQSDTDFSKTLLRNRFLRNIFKKGPLRERVPFIIYSNDTEMETYRNASLWAVSSYDHDSI